MRNFKCSRLHAKQELVKHWNLFFMILAYTETENKFKEKISEARIKSITKLPIIV